jgi:uncharacterized membrane protein
LIEEQADKGSESAAEQSPAPDPEEEIIEGKAAAILAYVPFMCFVPLVKMRNNQFALKHGKQGLILFLVEIIALIFLLPKISDLFWGFVIILCLGVAITGVLYAVQGKEWKIPYIGDLADKFKI